MKSLRQFDVRHDVIRALWCIDSETSEECLVDIYTKEIIAKRVNGKIVDPSEQKKD